MSDDPTATTVKKVRGRPFKSGAEWNGNRAGRPRGSRDAISDGFIEGLYNDWLKGGDDAIEAARKKNPMGYVNMVAGLLPKELHVKDKSLGDMKPGEISELIRELRAERARRSGTQPATGTATAIGKPGADSVH